MVFPRNLVAKQRALTTLSIIFIFSTKSFSQTSVSIIAQQAYKALSTAVRSNRPVIAIDGNSIAFENAATTLDSSFFSIFKRDIQQQQGGVIEEDIIGNLSAPGAYGFGGEHAIGYHNAPGAAGWVLQPGFNMTFDGIFDYLDFWVNESVVGSQIKFYRDGLLYRTVTIRSSGQYNTWDGTTTGGNGAAHTWKVTCENGGVNIGAFYRGLKKDFSNGRRPFVFQRNAVPGYALSSILPVLDEMNTQEGDSLNQGSIHIIMMAVNDWNQVPPATYFKYLDSLISKTIDRGNIPFVFFEPYPDSSSFPFAGYSVYEAVAKSVADKNGIGFYSNGIENFFAEGLIDAYNDVHPNNKGHRKMAENLEYGLANFFKVPPRIRCEVPLTVTIDSPQETLCSGKPIVFTATPSNIGSLSTYQWQVNGINTGNNNPFIINTLSDGDKVNVVLTSNANCVFNQTATSNMVPVSVIKSVVPSISINTPNSSICAGSTAVFSSVDNNVGTSPSYQWQVNGKDVMANANTFKTNSLNDGDKISLNLTSSVVCAVPQNTTSNTINMVVNPILAPSVSISTPNNNICANMTATFVATLTNGSRSSSYEWLLNGAIIANNSNMFTVGSSQNDYKVQAVVINNSNCTTLPTDTSNSIIISVNNPKLPYISISPDLSDIGLPTTVSALVTNAGFTPTYRWQDSSMVHQWQDIAGENQKSIVLIPSYFERKLRCIFSTTADCSSNYTMTSNTVLFQSSGTPGSISFYPNPATSVLVLDRLFHDDNWQTLSIANITGNQNLIVRNIAGEYKVSIDVQRLASGVYIGTLLNNKGKAVHFKFIKQ